MEHNLSKLHITTLYTCILYNLINQLYLKKKTVEVKKNLILSEKATVGHIVIEFVNGAKLRHRFCLHGS